MIKADERTTRPGKEPERKSDETGPLRPSVPKPEQESELIKRMKKVDPEQAKKYRQRSGQ